MYRTCSKLRDKERPLKADAQSIKRLDVYKIKSIINRVNEQMTVWEKIFVISKTETGLKFGMHYVLLEISKKRIRNSRKMSKEHYHAVHRRKNLNQVVAGQVSW